MEFWTSLINTPDKNDFLTDNCTHVLGDFWIFEGCNEVLDDELAEHEIVVEGSVPCLGGLSKRELVAGCLDWYGIGLGGVGPGRCEWTDEDGIFATGCGHNFFFDTDGIDENGFVFCPYCGCVIEAPGQGQEEE